MNKFLLIIALVFSALTASNINITTFHPHFEDITISIDAMGVIKPKQKTLIITKSQGFIALHVDENSLVNRGDLIASISDEKRRRTLAQRKKSLSILQSEQALQEEKLANSTEMYSMGVGSKSNHLSQKVTLQQLKNKKERLELEYETLLLEEKHSQIYAQKKGIVSKLIASNSYVKYGTKVADFKTEDTLIELYVSEQYATYLHKGMSLHVESNAQEISANIVNILFESQNNLITVIAKPSQNLALNLRVKASINIKTKRALRVHKEAIVLVENSPAIYKIKNNIAHLVPVNIIKDMGAVVWIEANISEDDDIALQNAYMLHNNVEVNIK